MMPTSIVTLGTRYCQDYAQSKKVILSNQIILLLIFFTLGEAMLYLFLGHFLIGAFTLLVTALYALCLFFNFKGRLQLSRFLFIFLINAAIFLYSNLLGKNIGMHYIYIVAGIIPPAIFDRQSIKRTLALSGLPIICYWLLEATQYRYFEKIVLPDPVQFWFSILLFTATALCLLGIFYFYVSLYDQSQSVLQRILKNSALTQRELEIVSKIMEGLSNKDIGKQLYIEESTVKRHVKHIFEKLKIKKRTELMALALET